MPGSIQPASRFLLESATGRVRKLLVKERARAMTGNLDEAMQALAEHLLRAEPAADRVAIGLLRAELIHADLAQEEALRILDNEVLPLLHELPDSHRAAVERNRVDLLHHAMRGTREFYHLVDRERASAIHWLDYDDLFHANQQAAAGKHYEALPILWQQLRRSYLSGCWYAQRVAAQQFMAECAALGEWDNAAHHLLLSRDEDGVRKVADGVTACGRPDVTQQVIGRVIATANLRSHFVIGCQLVRELADLIADKDIPRVADWLYPRAATVRISPIGPNIVSEAWKAVNAIGERLDIARAKSWLAMATQHSAWTTRLGDPTRVILERQDIVEAVLPIASVVRNTPDQVERLAQETLDLFSDCTNSSEYAKVLHLLCNLAEWEGSVKSTLADALFPGGQPVTMQLASVAGHFGKDESFNPERLSRMAARVATQIRLQVQRLEVGESPVVPDETLMQAENHTNREVPIVFVTGGSGLAALASHRVALADEPLTDLLRAILDLANDPDNPCANRLNLLSLLRDFADRVDATLRVEVVRSLEPLAAGPILESTHFQSDSEARNSLNPFKVATGSPDDVQARAMIAFAAFAYPDETIRERIWPLLTAQLYDPRPAIRRGACAAARLCPSVDHSTLAGVLAGLRDPDADIAVTAFAAVASQPGWVFDRSQWLALLAAARFAAASPNANLRRHAGHALRATAERFHRSVRAPMRELLERLRSDPAFSVRGSVSQP